MISNVPADDSSCSIADRLADPAESIEVAIKALEQQVIELDDAYYDALREARDASRRAAELRLQALETRVRLCALLESEPVGSGKRTSTAKCRAILRLAHIYFDEPGKYRLALYPHPHGIDKTPQELDEPLWCSKVVFDTTRPEGKVTVGIADVVRAAYHAAEERGCALTWAMPEAPAERQPGAGAS
jgi:hypothetical protein